MNGIVSWGGPGNPGSTIRVAGLAALLLCAVLGARAGTARRGAPELPEDLGPGVIDVSGYPPEHQSTYREVFLRVYGLLRGGPARVINAPTLEIDPAGERALRRSAPELFAEPGILAPSPDGWRKEVLSLRSNPPCCGACPVLSRPDAWRLRDFLAYDSLRRKTGAAAASWSEHRRGLLRRFAAIETKERRP